MKATFGAGCFWSVEAAFRQVEGVTGTRVGYAGGTLDNPTYSDVCSHTTGHAEVVEVTYDPSASRTTSCSRCFGGSTIRLSGIASGGTSATSTGR